MLFGANVPSSPLSLRVLESSLLLLPDACTSTVCETDAPPSLQLMMWTAMGRGIRRSSSAIFGSAASASSIVVHWEDRSPALKDRSSASMMKPPVHLSGTVMSLLVSTIRSTVQTFRMCANISMRTSQKSPRRNSCVRGRNPGQNVIVELITDEDEVTVYKYNVKEVPGDVTKTTFVPKDNATSFDTGDYFCEVGAYASDDNCEHQSGYSGLITI
eukprot:529376_1